MTNENKQTDYSKGKIYVIISPNCELVYYGSTVETLKKRFSFHKSQRDCTSIKIIDAGDADIYEIEKFPCSCKYELEDREAFYILNDWNGCVNELVPGAIRRAGGKKAYLKKYNATPENKIKKKAYNSTPKQKAYQKAYNTSTERRAVYRKYASKPEVKAHRAEKIKCNVCGCMKTRGNMSTHQKSKTCQKFLKNELDGLMNDIITEIEINN